MAPSHRSSPWLVALLLLTLPLPARAQAPTPAPKTLLFFGNSFTNGAGGVPWLVRNIAAAAGRPAPNVENAAVDGTNLAYHRANNTWHIATPVNFTPAPDFQWDAVVLQGYSTEATHLGNVPQFRADALGLYAAVQAHSPAVQPVLFETWARQPGHFFYPDTFPTADAMQAEVRTAYRQAHGDLAATGAHPRIAPVGDAFQRGGWSADLYGPDLYHASNRGYLLAALTLYATLYQDTTADIDLTPVLHPLGLTADDATQLTALADTAALVPNPEPTTPALLAIAASALALRRRRRSR